MAGLQLVDADYVPPAQPSDLHCQEAAAMESVAAAMRKAAAPLLELDPENQIGGDLEKWARRLDLVAQMRRGEML